MSLKFKELDINGLNNLEEKINKDFKSYVKYLSFISMIPIFLSAFVIVLSYINKYFHLNMILWDDVYMVITCFSVSFGVYFLGAGTVFWDKSKRLEELRYIKQNNIETIKYIISNNTIGIYLDNKKSILIDELEFSDVNKPILDFENGILKLRGIE